MTSTISFSGLSTGIDTEALISAIMEQESAPLTRLQTKLSNNTERSTLLGTIRTNLLSLSSSMNDLLSSAFENLQVSSSDEDGAYVTATANSAATLGTYQVQVEQVATAARHTLGAADTTSTVGTGTYAIQDVDGTTHTFTLDSSNDSLAGLRDAINASDADVTAKIVDTGESGSERYQLVITADDTGESETGRTTFTLAQTAGTNTLGIASDGVLDSEGNLTSGGTEAETEAKNAVFWVDEIRLTRSSNTVTDAVDGMTFQLNAGGQTSTSTPTTFTVETDVEGITEALQDVVDKFNAVWEVYSENATYETTTNSTDDEDSDTLPTSGLLANDQSIRLMLTKVRSTLISVGSGSSGDGYTSSAQFGFKTNQDGTISLDTSDLEDALEEDPSSVADVSYAMNTAMQSLVTEMTSLGSGSISRIRQQIDTQNVTLTQRIETTQARLDRREAALKRQYANLEAVISQLNSASSSLSSLS